MSTAFTNQQINKLGNTIIYLSNNVGELNKTKILKLLFLIEESSIKKFGHPFFGFDFQLWHLGPVLKDVFIDLSDDDMHLLNRYIKRKEHNSNEFEATAKFDDNEFSDNDIFLLEKVVEFARHKTTKDLIKHTHSENSLWRKSAVKNGVLQQLEDKEVNSTEYLIDFSLLFENNAFLKDKYENSLENLEFINHLKR